MSYIFEKDAFIVNIVLQKKNRGLLAVSQGSAIPSFQQRSLRFKTVSILAPLFGMNDRVKKKFADFGTHSHQSKNALSISYCICSRYIV
jgi:hypothetical protein